jgi:2-polyprenyl-3-methyl-5-hydroxy-6-metoxy-1,4-benzoquinol methylase
MDIKSTEQLRWNKKYERLDLNILNSNPTQWLKRHEDILISPPKYKALDIACGSGENSCYLASLGFEVAAVDISDVAINWLSKKMQQEKMSVFPQLRNLETELLPPSSSYDVILNFYYLQRSLFPSIKAALAPGGLLFFETFSQDHIEVVGSSINPNFVLRRGELLEVFSDLKILDYEEGVFEGKGVARLVAVKR